jgi:DNA gyrase subunit A
MGMRTREEDFVEHLFVASTHAYILIFTNTGRVYWLKVYEVPDVGAAGKGKHVGNLVALQPGETVRTMLEVRDLEEEGKHVFFTTRNGTVKKTPLKDFCNVMSRGIIAIGIDKDDELVTAAVTDGNQIVFLASHEGQAIRFDEEDVRPMGRPAYGVRGMDLDKGDYIVGMAVTPKPGKAPATPSIEEKLEAAEEKTDGKADGKSKGEKAKPSKKPELEAVEHPTLILSVTENGYGKRTPVDEYRLQSRGGKGVINVKTTARNGKVVGILLVDEESEAMLISHYGKIIRIDTKTIREAGRSTQGVRLLSLDSDDKVAAAVVIPPEEEDANGTLLQ